MIRLRLADIQKLYGTHFLGMSDALPRAEKALVLPSEVSAALAVRELVAPAPEVLILPALDVTPAKPASEGVGEKSLPAASGQARTQKASTRFVQGEEVQWSYPPAVSLELGIALPTVFFTNKLLMQALQQLILDQGFTKGCIAFGKYCTAEEGLDLRKAKSELKSLLVFESAILELFSEIKTELGQSVFALPSLNEVVLSPQLQAQVVDCLQKIRASRT